MSSYSYPFGKSTKESSDLDPLFTPAPQTEAPSQESFDNKVREITNLDAFFAPAPQTAEAPSPELFDNEVDNDNEVGEIDLTWSFDHFDDFFSTYRDTIPVNSTPALTYATDSSYENASSQYSYGLPPSVYSTLSEVETCSSVNDGSTDEFTYSAVSSNGPPAFPPADPVQAQSDYGTSEFPNFIEISPGDSSTMQQDLVSELPEPFPVLPAQVEPFRPFKCPHCPFASARKHNLKTHIKTHSKEDSDLFGCNICGRQLTRKHDLSRHYQKVHGDRMSSSSVSSTSNCRFNPISQIKRDQKPALPACPDSFSGFPPADGAENIMAWFKDLEACFEGV